MPSVTRTHRRTAVVAAPVALAATASVVGLGVALTGSDGGAYTTATTVEVPDVAAPAAAYPSSTVTTTPAASSPTLGPTVTPTPGTSAGTAGSAAGSSADKAGKAAKAQARQRRAAVTDLAQLGRRRAIVSRSDSRGLPPVTTEKPLNLTSELATRRAIRAAKDAGTQLWTTTDLNLWTAPGEKADQDGELEAGRHVLVTGRSLWGRVEVVVQGRSRWVSDGYLSADEPVAARAVAGLSSDPCPDGSVENGLTDEAVRVYRAVCHAFPEITSYGGWDAHGEHSSGRALDIMTSDVTLGTAIADFLQSHAGELDLYDVIWRQRIWTPVRAAEGWRAMPSRGSATANHYDHVHVSTNG